MSGLPAGRREFLLYLPLYNGVSSVELGVPEGRTIEKTAARAEGRRKPIVFYGTSITQGGCASRPGMVHTAILGRRLDRPVINLGFSGSGRMEPEMATLLAELDPAVYVLDCLPNMSAAEVAERVEPFVRTLRKAHPQTPIVMAEDRLYTNGTVLPGPRKRNADSHAALKVAYDHLLADGIKGLYYLPAPSSLAMMARAPSTDHTRPTSDSCEWPTPSLPCSRKPSSKCRRSNHGYACLPDSHHGSSRP